MIGVFILISTAKRKFICTRVHTHTLWNITQPEKMNEMMPFATTWLHLEIISRLNQAEKEKYHIDITYMCNLKKIYK